MIYSIDAELLSSMFEHSLGIKIVRGNNLNLFTSIPVKNGESVTFDIKEEMKISYFFGSFHYIFNVEFEQFVEDESLYKFVINEVTIEKNYRKHKRDVVQLDALILDSKDMYYATILDISDKGVKIETDRPLSRKKVDVIFAKQDGTSVKRKGKVMWKKEGKDTFYYGLSLK